MLRGGITTCNDMYFFPQARRGLRPPRPAAVLGITVIDFPSQYASDADDYLKGRHLRILARPPPDPFALAPHAPYTVANRSFERIGSLADELELPIHIHIHEDRHEIADSLRDFGRPIARLESLGLLGPLIGVHAVHLDQHDIERLALHRCAIAHCPTSNMKLASGAAPVARLLDKGLNVGLGTDGAASNNRLDLFREMQQASLLAKLSTGDAAPARPPRPAHGHPRRRPRPRLDHEIGSICPARPPTCALISPTPTPCPASTPSPTSSTCSADDVCVSDVAGQQRLQGGRLLQITNTELLSTPAYGRIGSANELDMLPEFITSSRQI
jgi:5-methylthioadenosine/S-adenosylhomocysteine deaminase